MIQQARVTGPVEYRQGDGITATIRPGPVEIETTLTDATLSWTDGDTHGAAAIPLQDFRRYVSKGAIELRD
jgi:hypothetical protein